MNEPIVLALSISPTHTLSKQNQSEIEIVAGFGVKGDAHMGEKVKHRSRVRQNPNQPNLRQVHLIHSELFEELEIAGFDINPGDMGENITTANLDILALPRDTILSIGKEVKLLITGLRNPCDQLNGIEKGLMDAVISKDDQGQLIRKAGIMSVVLSGGIIKKGDMILVEYPNKPYIKLDRV